MSFSNQITIGPEFFAKAKNDYADFHWAIVREFMQNSMDCGSDRIVVSVKPVDGDTLVTVRNNGSEMSRDILVGKLLALGGSGKGFQGTVGGFGKAKEILYFCHKSYEILSGSLAVKGSGAGYDLVEGGEFVGGTESRILMSGDHSEKLVAAFKKFCIYAQWVGTVDVNGVSFDCDLRKGSPRRELSFGTVYTNKSFSNRLIVRINGVPMFSQWTSMDRCVIVELKGTSLDCLTSNRDGLVYTHRETLDNFIEELATDKRKALKSTQPKYQHFGGAKFKHKVQRALNVRNLVDVAPTGGKRQSVIVDGPVAGSEGGGSVVVGPVGVLGESRVAALAHGGDGEWVESELASVVSQVSEEFVVKNETDLKIPEYYLPDSDSFGTYSRKLARIWGRLVLELHRQFEKEAEFAIGFVFDEESEAQYEEGEFGRVYYLNPAEVVRQSSSSSKSFKKRFALTERNRLLAIAAHEFVHGLGYSRHDDLYAAKLTDVLWKVMDERKRYNWCFA